MKIDKDELSSKINKIKGVVPKKPSFGVLEGVLVRDGYLIANNMEMSVMAKLEGAEGENFIIPERAFELISNLPDGEVELITEGLELTIKSKRIKNKYSVMDPAQFPIHTITGEGNSVRVSGETLLKAIKRVSFAIANMHSNSIMTSMYMKADNGELNFVGLDGHVLAWEKVEYEGNFEFLIPKATLEKLKALIGTGDIEIKHDDKSAAFISDDFEVYTRLIHGKYIDYTKILGKFSLHTKVKRNILLEAMVRAKLCTEEKVPVRFEFEKDRLTLSIKDKVTDYQESLILEEEIESPLTIGFDAKLVIETLKVFENVSLSLSLEGARTPMMVETEDCDFKAIILPIAINN